MLSGYGTCPRNCFSNRLKGQKRKGCEIQEENLAVQRKRQESDEARKVLKPLRKMNTKKELVRIRGCEERGEEGLEDKESKNFNIWLK